ncbi:hypothetical protein [Macrococcus equipercicus]|uniref:Uncharacterized protein n=1 Tax=Macrococcus equipercicus TaxID=69967 RepID=A0A9Q9BQH8_9STAP|nr:hypothetical protein [Macrococcus equipercicus]KAA1039333.1 hypothetical protein ERX35_007105 [Macrococcus equipercicus]UTH13624.1 hypothetical protein KFV11_10435 [Macrococcus equipercicus]
MSRETNNRPIWGTVYRVLNIAVIMMILARWFTPLNIGLYIILALAALLIVGLLDSLDRNRLRENRSRHIFDAIILVLFMILYSS